MELRGFEPPAPTLLDATEERRPLAPRAATPAWCSRLLGVARWSPANRVRVEGEVDMVVRVAVLFGDEFGFSVDELSWRRADDSGPGSPLYWAHSPNQLSLIAPGEYED